LREAYFGLKPKASAGIDGVTWQAYGQELESNLQNLSQRLVLGTYRAKPIKRVYIPKADGRQRPIGIPVLEDKSGWNPDKEGELCARRGHSWILRHAESRMAH
jgi:RNA-directed DNA polymerase